MSIESFMNDVKTSCIALLNSEIHPEFAAVSSVAKTRIILKTCMVVVAVGLVTALVNLVLGSVVMIAVGIAAFAYFTNDYHALSISDLSKSFGFDKIKDQNRSALIKEIAESKMSVTEKIKAISVCLFNLDRVKEEWTKGKYGNAIAALMP